MQATAIPQYSYMISTTVHSDVFVKSGFKAACSLAEHFSKLHGCTSYVYRFVLDNGRPRLIEEAQYINGE